MRCWCCKYFSAHPIVICFHLMQLEGSVKNLGGSTRTGRAQIVQGPSAGDRWAEFCSWKTTPATAGATQCEPAIRSHPWHSAFSLLTSPSQQNFSTFLLHNHIPVIVLLTCSPRPSVHLYAYIHSYQQPGHLRYRFSSPSFGPSPQNK